MRDGEVWSDLKLRREDSECLNLTITASGVPMILASESLQKSSWFSSLVELMLVTANGAQEATFSCVLWRQDKRKRYAQWEML